MCAPDGQAPGPDRAGADTQVIAHIALSQLRAMPGASELEDAAHIRRAVLLRDQRCAWPRCGRPAIYCDVHHLRHKKDGGPTSVEDCILLCQFHHDVCIHRWGWQLILHPDGTTTAYGPHGQVLHSHSPPPTIRAG